MPQRFNIWDAIADARRLIAPLAGEWHAVADEVWDADNKRMCRCTSPWAADLIAASHNLFLPMSNALLMARKKAADQQNMRND